MNQTGITVSQTHSRQKTAFWLALIDFLTTASWIGIRLCFALIGDSEGDRKFVLNPTVLQVFPVVVLIWIVSFVMVGNSVVQSRRATSYGIWASILLTITAVPVVIAIGRTYGKFFTAV
jgi:hypothetical protein